MKISELLAGVLTQLTRIADALEKQQVPWYVPPTSARVPSPYPLVHQVPIPGPIIVAYGCQEVGPTFTGRLSTTIIVDEKP